MSKIIEIHPEPLTSDRFAPYGTAILLPSAPAPKKGKDWDCWFYLGRLGVSEENPTVGIVHTRLSDDLIEHMEAHLHPEFLLPVTGPVIQPVALPLDPSDPNPQPDAATVRAFIIEPGQSIVMGNGVWHCAALPLKSDTWYYFVADDNWDGPGTNEQPWILFKNEDKIKLVLD